MPDAFGRVRRQSQVQRALVNAFENPRLGKLNWKPFELDAQEWEQHELIGSGMECEVYEGTLLSHRDKAAVDCCIKFPYMTGNDAIQQVLQETAILLRAQQQIADDHVGKHHIVELIGFCFKLPTVAVLLGLCSGGDLAHVLADISSNSQNLPIMENESSTDGMQMQMGSFDTQAYPGKSMLSKGYSLLYRLEWAIQVAKGMAALHSVRIAHMDLKVENVLLSEDGCACVTDFGCSIVKCDNSTLQLHPANVGTPSFMAPEVHIPEQAVNAKEGNLQYDPLQADLFSFGFILYQCITLNREPDSRSRIEDTTFLASTPITVSNEELDSVWFDGCAELKQPLRALLKKCWHEVASERGTFSQVVISLEGMIRDRRKSIITDPLISH